MFSLGQKLDALNVTHGRVRALNLGLPHSVTDTRERYTAVVMATFNAAMGVWNVANVFSISRYELACALVTVSLVFPDAHIQLKGVEPPLSQLILTHMQELYHDLDPDACAMDFDVAESGVTLNWPGAAQVSSTDPTMFQIQIIINHNHAATIRMIT